MSVRTEFEARGDAVGAGKALAWGLVEKLAPPQQLDAAVHAALESILACGADALRAFPRSARPETALVWG